MLGAIKSFPFQTKPAVSTLFSSLNNFVGKASPAIQTIRFQQASAGHQQPDHNMEKNQQADEKKQQEKQPEKKGDVMSHSFGEGYSTRSDEEGFGGIYGDNQSLSHDDEEKVVHGNSPDYDKTQGSEVKEKEKARHQGQVH